MNPRLANVNGFSGIVDNLLFVARVDAAREPIARRQFDARATVEKIAAFYQTIAEDRHVAIHCSGEGEIYADSVLFQRAVSNLVITRYALPPMRRNQDLGHDSRRTFRNRRQR